MSVYLKMAVPCETHFHSAIRLAHASRAPDRTEGGRHSRNAPRKDGQLMYYIAWLNGCSVARGTEAEVRAAALNIFKTERWQDTVTARGKSTVLRITRGARQVQVCEEQLE